MPAINLSRTDTFEQQRLKINQIGDRLFDVTGGGSDLSTGNLKLGDGTVTTPSLAFDSNPTLGIYKSNVSSFGIVSEEKNVIDFSQTEIVSFKDLTIQQKVLTNSGTSITNSGSNYDVGTFSGIEVVGGSGLGATLNIDVIAFTGTITNQGANYAPGSFTSIALVNTTGSGDGAVVSFEVDGILGVITDPGSGYTDGQYENLAVTNVSGSGSGATVTVDVSENIVASAVFSTSGIQDYAQGDVLTATIPGGSGFEFTVTSNPGKVVEVQFTDRGSGYATGDVLVFPSNTSTFSNISVGGEVTSNTTLSTSSAQITVDSTTGILQGAEVIGGPNDVGELAADTTVQSIDSATTLTLSATPTTAGDAELTFTTGNPSELTLPNTTGVEAGQTVFVVSGTAIIDGITVDEVDTDNNIVVLSGNAQQAGTADIQFGPPMGDPVVDFEFTVGNLGVIDAISVQDGGNGYAAGDNISVSPEDLVIPTTIEVSTNALQTVEFIGTISAATFSVGDALVIPVGSILSVGVQQSSDLAGQADAVYNNLTATGSAAGVGALFRITRSDTGEVDSVEIVAGGSGYEANELLTILGSNVGGANDTDDVVISVTSVAAEGEDIIVDQINSTGGTLDSLVLRGGELSAGVSLVVSGTTTPLYNISTASEAFSRFFLDDVLHPDLTLYSGDTYIFDLSLASGDGFAFSEFPDGSNAPSLAVNRTATLTAATTTFTVDDATGILPNMAVSVVSGTGAVAPNTFVSSVVGTTITISAPATVSGLAVLTFAGYEYSIGVTRTESSLTIKVGDNTPDLYYYSNIDGNENYGGTDTNEGLLTTDNNNPRTFGTGALFAVNAVATNDIITNNIATGQLTAVTLSSANVDATVGDITTLTSTTVNTNTANLNYVYASGDLSVSSGGTTTISSGNFDVGAYLQIDATNGNLTTTGTIKTTTKFNSNEKLEISENKISTVPGQQLLIEPGGQSELVKILSTSALVIPAGDNNQRPSQVNSSNGAIRFNTITNQYEGYSQNTTSWSSLGGVRDLDGNTYILAEQTVGANDNTLWFYNDNVNTVKFTPEYQEFVNVKKIRSGNVSAPAYEEFRSNAPVSLGEYLKYRNNIYEVTAAGTTGTAGNEPTHTTGAETSGTAELTYFTTAVSSLTFEEISELRIDPLGFTDLVVNNEIRLSNNVISTNTNDLNIQPNAGQKVSIIGTTSLVIPVGDNNSKGNAAQGSIRYNTDDNQFEGYNGTQWGGLGGVKDIDQDTEIKAETGPGNDEDTLYFINANNESMRLTTLALELDTVDTINSVTSNTLNVNANLFTLDSLSTVIDNTVTDTTFLYSTREFFDIGLSTGLTTDPLLRLTDEGDVFFNIGFGGTYQGIKIFDNELKEFELADYKIVTKKVDLVKGTFNAGDAVIYNPGTEESAKVEVVAHNTTTGDKEVIEYSVTDNGTDIFYTEIGNISTGTDLIESVFDIDVNNRVRLTFTLNTALAANDQVEVTIVSKIIKR